MVDAAEVDFWTPTVVALQPLFSDPPLSEKHLKRPPFRFIHDVVRTLQEKYQCFGTTFADAELSQKIEGKEEKVAFLEKLLAYMKMALGRPIDVASKKIVAGSEPERTNKMLQDLAIVVDIISKTKSGAPPPPPGQPQDAPPPPPSQQQQTRTDVTPVHAQDPPPPPPPLGNEQPSTSVKGRPPPLQIDAIKAARRQDTKSRITKLVAQFSGKIQNFGLDLSTNTQGTAISTNIIAMMKELKSREIPPTQPTTMEAEALQRAIQRQLETILQVQQISDQNDGLISELISSTMGD